VKTSCRSASCVRSTPFTDSSSSSFRRWTGFAAWPDHFSGLRSRSGTSSPAAVHTLCHKLGLLLRDLGEDTRALQMLQRAAVGRRTALGEAHVHTLASMTKLSELYLRAGHLAQVEPLQLALLQGCRKAFGSSHPNTHNAAAVLADIYQQSGRLEAAEPLYEEAVAGLRKGLRADGSPLQDEALATLTKYCVLLIDLGKGHQAQPLLTDAFKARRRLFGPRDPTTLRLQAELVELLVAQQKTARAREVLGTDTMELANEVLDEHSPTLHKLETLDKQLLGHEVRRWRNTYSGEMPALKLTPRSSAIG